MQVSRVPLVPSLETAGKASGVESASSAVGEGLRASEPTGFLTCVPSSRCFWLSLNRGPLGEGRGRAGRCGRGSSELAFPSCSSNSLLALALLALGSPQEQRFSAP